MDATEVQALRDRITEYLQHLAPGAFCSQDIVTPGSLGIEDVTDGTQVPNGKVLMLELLCERAHLTDRHEYRKRVLFFDDDPENIRDCVLAGFKRSTHTPDGFTRSALAAIASRAGRKRGACAMA